MDEIKDDAGFTAWPSRTCHQPLTDELRAGVTEARAREGLNAQCSWKVAGMLTPNSALQLPQTSFRPVVTIYKEITCAPFESMRATHNGLRGFLKNQAHLRQLMLFASLVDAFCLVRAQLETFRASSAEDFGSLRKPDGTNFWTHGGKRNHAKERFAE